MNFNKKLKNTTDHWQAQKEFDRKVSIGRNSIATSVKEGVNLVSWTDFLTGSKKIYVSFLFRALLPG